MLQEAEEKQYSLPLPALAITFSVQGLQEQKEQEEQEDQGHLEAPDDCSVYLCPVYSTISRSLATGGSSYCFSVALPCRPGAAEGLATAGAAILTQ